MSCCSSLPIRATPAPSWTRPAPPEPAAAPSSTQRAPAWRVPPTLWGVELVNEKELVLIVSRTTLKNQIMQAIMQGAGPKAGAIVFSLPVTDTAGLRLLDEE